MMALFPLDVEYLVFTVNQSQYGVPYFDVVSVMDIPNPTAIPHQPLEMRGVIPFREGSIPLFDLRVCFGLKARTQETEELITTMAQRKQDHINWVNNLKKEVLNNLPITVQTDPHKCAFGKWYDQFHSDNANLAAYMLRFDAPHKQIHAVGTEITKLQNSGDYIACHTLLHRTENETLVRLLELFDGIADQVRKYLLEYVIIFDKQGTLFGIVVDDINFFSLLLHIEHPLPHGLTSSGSDLIQALGRYRQDGGGERDVLLLDMERLLHQYDKIAA
ncbi:MAG: chemotaxis protein CheW [Magnetococcus sp. DMHC-6]